MSTSRSISLFTLACILATGFCHAESLPEISILETNPVTSEGDHANPARLTLVRTGPTTASLAVNLLIGGTATPYPPPSDFFPFDVQCSTFDVGCSPPIIVTVDSGTGYTVASPATSTATVFDTW